MRVFFPGSSTGALATGVYSGATVPKAPGGGPSARAAREPTLLSGPRASYSANSERPPADSGPRKRKNNPFPEFPLFPYATKRLAAKEDPWPGMALLRGDKVAGEATTKKVRSATKLPGPKTPPPPPRIDLSLPAVFPVAKRQGGAWYPGF